MQIARGVLVVLLAMPACSSTKRIDAPVVSAKEDTDFSLYVRSPLEDLRSLALQPNIARVLGKRNHETLLQGLKTARDETSEWPTEIVIAAGTGSSRVLGDLIGIVWTATNAFEAEVALGYRVKQKIAGSLESLRVPEFAATMRFSSERAAQQVFDSTKAFLSDAEAAWMSKGRHEARRSEWSVRASDHLTAEALAAELVDYGLLDTIDADALELAANIVKLQLRVALSVEGKELVFALGHQASLPAPSIDSARKMAMVDSPSGFLAARWRVEEMQVAIREWTDALVSFEAPSTTVNELRTLAAGFDFVGPSGDATVWIDDGLHYRGREYAVPSQGTLSDAAVVAATLDSEAYFATTSSSVEALAAYVISKVEERLERDSIKGMVGGDFDNDLADRYYERFATLRDLIYKRAALQKPYPIAIVVTAEGRVRSATVGGDKAVIDQPVPEIAVVAASPQRTQLMQYTEKLYGELILAIFETDYPTSAAANLGLGIPTRRYLAGWLGKVAPSVAAMSIDSDLVPHVIDAGTALVFSSSPRLTRIVRKRLSKKTARPLPRGTITTALLTGGEIARYVDMVESWGRFSGASVPTTFSTIRQYLALLDRISFQVVQQGDTATSAFDIALTR